jgi:hypothetical protein
MKFHAYVGASGSVRKSAYQVKAERIRLYRGGPSPEKFFSLHRESRRKPMEHVKGPGRPFFRYSDGSDDGGPGGPGESIEHLLFKEAVASLARTRLSITGHDHEIIITHGETEKLIPGASRPYRADVYLRFESKKPSELGLKWSQEVYVEIHRTNLVEPGKHDEVRSLGLPMVEVTVPEVLLYRHGGAETTDALEREYVQWLKSVLEGERGFLKATMLSDPSSAPYLAKKLAEAQVELNRRQQGLIAAGEELKKEGDENKTLRQSLANAEKKIEVLSAKVSTSNAKAAELAKTVTTLTSELDSEQQARSKLGRQLRTTRLIVAGTALSALGLSIAWVRLRFGMPA